MRFPFPYAKIPPAAFLNVCLTLAALFAAAAALTSCSSSSFCGAPCEKPPEQSAPEKPAKPKQPQEVLVNQYGSVFGHMEVDTLTEAQLKTERASLEILLSLNEKDKEILAVLKEGKLDTTTFDYNDYSTGGSRFNASGKLRRDAGVKVEARRLPRMISESQNRELIERYRQVRRRLTLLPMQPGKPAESAADTTAEVPPASPDSVWSGFYRVDADSAVPAMETFRDLEACKVWGRTKAGEFRSKAYAFECECRKDGDTVKWKQW
jgi:hypothetical protein